MTNSLIVRPPADIKAASIEELKKLYSAFLDLQFSAGEITDKTRSTYMQGVSRFLNWFGKNEVSEEVIRKWIASLREGNLSPNTINTWLAGVRSFFSWCVRNRYSPYNPTEGVRGAKKSGLSQMHLREALTDDEIVRLIDSIDTLDKVGKRDKAMVALMAFCGCRQSDINRADYQNLKQEQGKYVLHIQGKGRRELDEVIVVASKEAEGYLKDYLAVRNTPDDALFISFSDRSYGKRLSLVGIRTITKAYFGIAKITGNKSTHSLRHSAAGNALRHGAPIQKVQSMLRHKNIGTTMIYLHEVDRIENPGEDYVDYREEKK